jgi:hypothetical protein
MEDKLVMFIAICGGFLVLVLIAVLVSFVSAWRWKRNATVAVSDCHHQNHSADWSHCKDCGMILS